MAASILFMSAKNCESIELELDYHSFQEFCIQAWPTNVEELQYHDLGLENFILIEFDILHSLNFKFNQVTAYEVILTLVWYL